MDDKTSYIEHLKLKKSLKKATKSAKKGIDKGVKKIKKASLEGVMDAVDDIAKVTGKIGGFFEKFGKHIERFLNNLVGYFSNWESIVKYMENPTKALAIILTICVPIFGQLMARVMLFNGSMDQLWLMLFAIPPVTIVPASAMIFGFIKPLQGGSPWDNMVWIPLIGTFIGSMIGKENKMLNIFKVIFGVGSFCLVYWYKSKRQCKKQNGAPLSKIALDSLTSYLTVLVLSVALPFIPFVGQFFEAVTMLIPGGDLLLQAFAVFLVYVGTNIVNGSLNFALCKVEIPETDLHRLLMAVICMTFIVSYAPGSMLSAINSIKYG